MSSWSTWLNSAGTDLASLGKKLGDSAQEAYRRASTGGDGPLVRSAVVSGSNSNYHFSLLFEPRSEGGGLCQTGVLKAVATQRADGGEKVNITCRWKRRIGAHLIEIPRITEDTYHMSADDIGMDIVCVAEPVGGQFHGAAYGVLGPFELDPITRMSLENLIASGASRFPVRHYTESDPNRRDLRNEPPARDLQLVVTQDCVKVVHPSAGGGGGGGHEDVANFTADYPKVVINPLEKESGSREFEFVLELSDDREKVYHFSALSRTSRDLIALLIRCFHSRKYVATSFILSRLYQNPATPGAPLTGPIGREEFDVHGLAQRLAKELDRTVGQLDSVDKVVRNATTEKAQLMEQLQETIGSYTEAIEKLHQQLAFAKGGPAAQVQLQIHDARALHQRLQLEANEVKKSLDEEQTKAPSASGTSEAESLRQEIVQLRGSITSLAGEAASQSNRDNTRAEELRRLRHDVEILNGEKDGLDKCAKQADRDKQDLVENFLYVKGLLDKLQMASLESPAASPEVEREVAQLKAEYGKVVDERNRLAVRVEQLDRDREKQKAQREAALERVMNANARALEERDRLEKEKARVSQLYQQTMGAMGATSQAGSSGADGSGGYPSGGSPAELETLKAELAQKTELLAKREQESESLRSRLRKLAMV